MLIPDFSSVHVAVWVSAPIMDKNHSSFIFAVRNLVLLQVVWKRALLRSQKPVNPAPQFQLQTILMFGKPAA